MSVTSVQAEASQCLFEFLHMEVVRWAEEREVERKEKKVGVRGRGVAA